MYRIKGLSPERVPMKRHPGTVNSKPFAYAHPDDVIAVFDHAAVWIDGTAIEVKSRYGLPRGTFFVVNPEKAL